MATTPFQWGAGGRAITPAEAASARKMAEALGASRQKVASNGWEGLAQIANALSERAWRDEASRIESEGQESVARLLAGIGPESSFEDLNAVLSNPWASPQQSAVAQALLNQNMQQSDPKYQMEQEKLRLELEALNAPPAPAQPEYVWEGDRWWEKPVDGGAPIAASEAPAPDMTSAIQNYEYLVANGVDPAVAQQAAFGGQTTNVNVNTGSTNDFFTGLSEAETGNFASMLQAGAQASRNLAQLGQLEELLASTPQGLEGAATQFAANFGIDLGGAQGVQAAQALINQMVPAQRPPGTGPMSDADLELYKQSIPRIINQPGGNELIIGTMRAINEYDRQLAAIVQDGVARAELTDDPAERAQIRREMRAAIDGLQNPIDVFKAQAGQMTGASSAAPAGPASTTQMAAPASEAEYNALPSGTPFRAPDGSIRIKP